MAPPVKESFTTSGSAEQQQHVWSSTHYSRNCVPYCLPLQDDGDVGSDPTIEPNPEGGIAVLTVTRRGSRYTLQVSIESIRGRFDVCAWSIS